jgi:hypothetical protein
VFDPPNARQRNPHNFLVQGLVPNSVSRVLVQVTNRRRVIIDVKENVFSALADKPIHVKQLLRD